MKHQRGLLKIFRSLDGMEEKNSRTEIGHSGGLLIILPISLSIFHQIINKIDISKIYVERSVEKYSRWKRRNAKNKKWVRLFYSPLRSYAMRQ